MDDRYLFKAKRIDNGEWIVGNLLTIAKINSFICTGKIKLDGALKGHIYPEMYAVDVSTICQCTGVLDKRKNLIWENDIVRYCDCTEERYVIAWEENKACYEYQQYGCSIMNFDELSGIEVEVIGSYIDNPELLEVE